MFVPIFKIKLVGMLVVAKDQASSFHARSKGVRGKSKSKMHDVTDMCLVLSCRMGGKKSPVVSY